MGSQEPEAQQGDGARRVSEAYRGMQVLVGYAGHREFAALVACVGTEGQRERPAQPGRKERLGLLGLLAPQVSPALRANRGIRESLGLLARLDLKGHQGSPVIPDSRGHLGSLVILVILALRGWSAPPDSQRGR